MAATPAKLATPFTSGKIKGMTGGPSTTSKSGTAAKAPSKMKSGK
jgi:hypothetical protein